MKQLQNLMILGVLISLFIGCDNEFIELDSDLINRDVATNFDIDSVEYDVIAYNLPLGPVRTNGLPTNYIGYYEDNTYGSSEYSFVTQLSPTSFNPTFGNNVEIDSVVFFMPYYSTLDGTDELGNNQYIVDSIFGDGLLDITIYENDYFLRDFDPNGDFSERQVYYSNQSISETEFVPDNLLEGSVIHEVSNFEVSKDPIFLTDAEGDTTQTLQPGMRFKLDTLFWHNKIILKEGEPELSNANAFNNYFRGIYMKSETVDGKGPLIGLNLATTLATITIYYTSDTSEETEDRLQFTYDLSFFGNQANFIENNFSSTIPVGDKINGDERLYLKGGEGNIAGIQLFPGETEDDDSVFESFKNNFAEYEDGKFQSSKRLINEANLVLYVDQDMVSGNEPDRIYLYDLQNNQPLADYASDVLVNAIPRLSLSSHLGVLERVGDEPDGEGIKYVMRVTRHLNNLIERDSSNVRLGLAVSANVNLENGADQGEVQSIEDSESLVPLSSILSPRGTVLHGNRTSDPTKRIKLQIFYSCLSDSGDCEN